MSIQTLSIYILLNSAKYLDALHHMIGVITGNSHEFTLGMVIMVNFKILDGRVSGNKLEKRKKLEFWYVFLKYIQINVNITLLDVSQLRYNRQRS